MNLFSSNSVSDFQKSLYVAHLFKDRVINRTAFKKNVEKKMDGFHEGKVNEVM